MPLHEISAALVREIRHRAEARHVSTEVLLRELLRMPVELPVRPPTFEGPLVVLLPDGTRVRGQRNGRTYEAVVREGKIDYAGRLYSPSQAAMTAIRPHEFAAINGWNFWRVEVAGKWVCLDHYRSRPTRPIHKARGKRPGYGKNPLTAEKLAQLKRLYVDENHTVPEVALLMPEYTVAELRRYLHIYNLTHTSTPAVAAATPERTP